MDEPGSDQSKTFHHWWGWGNQIHFTKFLDRTADSVALSGIFFYPLLWSELAWSRLKTWRSWGLNMESEEFFLPHPPFPIPPDWLYLKRSGKAFFPSYSAACPSIMLHSGKLSSPKTHIPQEVSRGVQHSARLSCKHMVRGPWAQRVSLCWEQCAERGRGGTDSWRNRGTAPMYPRMLIAVLDADIILRKKILFRSK